MPQYRVRLDVPGKEKPIEAFCRTEAAAVRALRLFIEAGQPKGTTYKITKTEERVVMEGAVEE